MEIIVGDSKNFASIRWFDWINLADTKKVVLVNNSTGTEYYVELLDKPTKPYLQGKLALKQSWYRHTRNDVKIFEKEHGPTKTIKEINKRLDEGFKIRDILYVYDAFQKKTTIKKE